MAELDIPGVAMNQEYRVKLGKSFTFPKENAFHTIKYDFKPLSVDNNKPGKLRVGEGDEVNVSLPVVQAESADDVAQFRGPKRPCTRECVLIINTETGEAILEKIGSSVKLKSVRDGRPKPSRDRSVSPAPFSKNAAMGKMVGHGKSPAPSGSSSSHKHSKVSKLLAKSRPKRSSEQYQSSLGAGNSSSAGSGNSLKTSQVAGSTGGDVSTKPKKKQSKYSNIGLTPHSDLQQSSPFLSLPKASTSAPSVLVPLANESNPFNQGVNNQLEVGSGQNKQTLEDSSGSSSGSGTSSSSSDSDSEDESPVQPSFPLAGGYPTGGAAASGGGVNAPPPSGPGVLNMPSLQQPHLASLQQPHLASLQQPHLASLQQPHLASLQQPHLASLQQPHLASLQQPHLASLQQPHLASLQQPHLASLQQPHLANRVPPSMPVFGGGSVSSGGMGGIPPFPVQPSRTQDDSSSSSGSDSESSSDSSSGSSSDSSDNEENNKGRTAVQQAPPNIMRSISTLEHELSCSSSDSD